MASDQSEGPLANRRILLVDDQPSIRGVLEVALTAAGADVWVAADGAGALRAIDEALPDLVLLDLAMPGMTGWDVLKALRASPRLARIPVVLQSSAQDFASFDQARNQGVAAFLSKPYRLNEVIETCRRILRGARPLQGILDRQEERISVQVRDAAGALIAMGHLLDHAPTGAQMEIGESLSLGQSVTLVFHDGGVSVTQTAEVRWVSGGDGGYQHGLAFPRRR